MAKNHKPRESLETRFQRMLLPIISCVDDNKNNIEQVLIWELLVLFFYCLKNKKIAQIE